MCAASNFAEGSGYYKGHIATQSAENVSLRVLSCRRDICIYTYPQPR